MKHRGTSREVVGIFAVGMGSRGETVGVPVVRGEIALIDRGGRHVRSVSVIVNSLRLRRVSL